MKNTTKNITRLAAAGLIAAAALLTPSASATTMIRLTVEELTVRSTDVLTGTVTRVESRWTDDHQQILTYITMNTTETLKGDLRDEVTFVQLGGRVDDHLMLVVGAPEFQPNMDVVVFLTQMNFDKRLAVNTDRWLLGLGQGAWVMARDAQGKPVAASQLPQGCAIERPGVPAQIQLDPPALKQRIRAAAADVRACNLPTPAQRSSSTPPSASPASPVTATPPAAKEEK